MNELFMGLLNSIVIYGVINLGIFYFFSSEDLRKNIIPFYKGESNDKYKDCVGFPPFGGEYFNYGCPNKLTGRAGMRTCPKDHPNLTIYEGKNDCCGVLGSIGFGNQPCYTCCKSGNGIIGVKSEIIEEENKDIPAYVNKQKKERDEKKGMMDYVNEKDKIRCRNLHSYSKFGLHSP